MQAPKSGYFSGSKSSPDPGDWMKACNLSLLLLVGDRIRSDLSLGDPAHRWRSDSSTHRSTYNGQSITSQLWRGRQEKWSLVFQGLGCREVDSRKCPGPQEEAFPVGPGRMRPCEEVKAVSSR